MKANTWRHTLTLRQRLIISAILCVFLPSLITLVVSNYITKDELEKRAVTNIEETLRYVELNVTSYLEDLIYVSNYLQFDNKINTLLKENEHQIYDNSKDNLNAIKNIKITNDLRNIINILSPFYLTILLEDGFSYTNYSKTEYNPNNFLTLDWFKDISDSSYNSINWIGVHPTYIKSDQAKEPNLITITRTLKLSQTKNAYTIISINESDISDILEEANFNNQQEFMLIDADGVILSSDNKKEIQKQFNYNYQIENEQSNYSIVTYKGMDYFLVSYPLTYNNWNLVSLVPYKEMVGNVNTITRNTLILQYLFFAAFLILLIYLVTRLTRPINKLSLITKEVEKGNLQVRSKFQGAGDIETLGYSFDKMLDQIEEMINQIKKEEKGKRKAELEMLQAQINPHFLFNILNSIRLKITLNGDKHSGQLIQSLSSLLRMTINRNNEFITLQEEIETVHHYVKLMNFRHNGHVEIINELSSETLMVEVPRFFLQPIIENAIIHGFNQKGGNIIISAAIKNNLLFIGIKDNGKGMSEGVLCELQNNMLHVNLTNQKVNRSSFTGIGLKNVYQRLLLIYGNEFHMEINSQIEKGTEIEIYIPMEEGVLSNV
ncbi:sensor histidine kinase [Oceanobacillus zhaokaii]|nr:sensor histidine kinase [Oceanobacillus zhaokaii]